LHLRKQIGARNGDLSARGADALRRQLEVVILFQSCADEFLELWILEDLPPGKVREGCRLRLRLWVFCQIAVHDPSTQSKYNILGVTADAAFQLDLFGRLRRATEAARARLLATEDAKNTVLLTLVSDVASDYFELLDLDLELRITEDTVKTQEESVKLTQLRLDHGVATKLDVLQAEQVRDTANAQIPELERQIGQEEDAISILLGHDPEGVRRGRPLAEQPIPPDVPPGMPSSLLERRPDIRQVEQDLIAANAEIGVARAAFFPQISLTGSGGGAFGRSSHFTGLMRSQTGIWSYGAQVSQPIFTGGALRGNLRLAESQHRQELIVYQQAIQLAFRDVSDALIGYQKLHQVRVAQETRSGICKIPSTHPSYGIGAASPPTSKSSMGSDLCSTPSSRSPRPEATSAKAWSSFTRRLAEAGSRVRNKQLSGHESICFSSYVGGTPVMHTASRFVDPALFKRAGLATDRAI